MLCYCPRLHCFNFITNINLEQCYTEFTFSIMLCGCYYDRNRVNTTTNVSQRTLQQSGALMSVNLIREGCMSAGGVEGNGFKAFAKSS